jgi:poly(3-hydroxybutyrate) depolymerase
MLLNELFVKMAQFPTSIRSTGRAWRPAATSLVVCVLNAAAGAQTLPSLAIDPQGVTVSGVSSGGFMAVQFAVAHSAMVRGVGVIAAGPYACAQIHPLWVSDVCLHGRPDPRESVAAAAAAASLGSIDAPSQLERIRAWVLADGTDPVVGPDVVEAARDFLGAYAGDKVKFMVLSGAGHSMPTVDHGGRCSETGGTYLNACGFDAASQMLDYLYPQAAEEPDAGGELRSFEQAEFIPGWRRLLGNDSLAKLGYLYVPRPCRRGGCRLHVALHGCRQGATGSNQEFVRYAGYNPWATRHPAVILYPQIATTRFTWYTPWLELNPEGCWDWWGYSGADYAVRSGVQIAAIAAMIERLQQPVGEWGGE